MSDIELKKHAKEYHNLTLNQFKLMCNEADKRYEGQTAMTEDEALEHTGQKHIGYYYPEDRKTYFVLQKGSEVPKNALPLYEHPTQSWQGLTDYEIQSITWKIWGADALEPELDYARAIEQALQDKNS